MTCRISYLQDGRSLQLNPLVSLLVDFYEWNEGSRTIAPLGQLPPQFYFGGFMLFYALWFDWLSIFPVFVFNSM